ncbi:ImmA/IrrE family metallo-endopeptidase [Levilactobacillus brevis]|uniref:ImmA/IrrE family metallo-endopeptidase n=1 Tax=Levilactobacillus brevis TaxID=1580 RepID=UPI0012E76440|nr:ImmA/IrrE family metallo-endopeptidase [Levilactobacillus brevis]MUV40617.1 ImmA/IrrE family metallo-endopeptidase [Levilactobacillus brevis]
MEKISNVVKTVTNRYHTANPFTIADRLNIQVEWCYFGHYPLGKTVYDGEQPIVMLNESIMHTPKQYFVMGHELGHTILQEGLVGYYTSSNRAHGQLETEADEFSVALMGLLYIEDNDEVPYSYKALANQYGLPFIDDDFISD